jgi:hypothetical protein
MDIEVHEFFVVPEGSRLKEVLHRAYRMNASSQGTFGERFNTKSHQRSKATEGKVVSHAHLLIERALKKNGFDWEEWRFVRHGSNKVVDVVASKDQHYRVERIK